MITTIVAGLGAGVGVDVSPDGTTAYVVEWSNGELIQVDVRDRTVATVMTGLVFPQDVLVNWDSGRIFVSERTGAVKQVFGPNESTILATLKGAPHQLALSEDGDRLYVVCYESGELHRIDVPTGTSVVVASGLGHPVGLVVDRGESEAFVTEQDTSSLTRLDLATGTIIDRSGGLTAPFFLAWDTDGTGVRCVQRDPSNSLAHLDPGPPMSTLSMTSGLDWRPSGVAASRDDSLILVATDRTLQAITASPLPPVPPPEAPFTIESIEFDRERGHGIPLEYHDQAMMVPSPEWTAGRSHPVAYPMGSLPHVNVVLRQGPGFVPGAYALGATGNLGGVRRATVTPVFDANGLSAPILLEFMWPLRRAVDAVTVSLDWYARSLAAPSAPAPIGSTSHRVYSVLGAATAAPWNSGPAWVAALERACTWASGATDADSAAAAITRAYNGCGVVSYDTVSGATAYGSGTFNLSEMLERLEGGIGLGAKVNCTDSADTVSTLANALGCELWQSRMGWSFDLNPVIAIGYSTWEVPFGSGFSYHEIAWKGSAGVADRLFDGCLHVDGDSNPDAGPHTPLLPIDMVFGDCTTLDYRRRLCPPGPGGCAACQPQPGTRQRRAIA